jgi:hypothetical protein
MADPGSASNGSPPREFWEDDLEMSIEHVLAEADSDEFMGNWLDKRTGPQVRMLRHLIHLAPDVSVQAGRTELQERLDDLRRFVPCAQFAKNKLTQAIIDFALLRISAGTSALAEVGDSGGIPLWSSTSRRSTGRARRGWYCATAIRIPHHRSANFSLPRSSRDS